MPPADHHGALRIEVYRNLWRPDENLATVVLWSSVAPPGAAGAEILAFLRGLPGADDEPLIAAAAAAPPSHAMALLATALTRVVAQAPGMPLLRANLEERRALLTAELAATRGDVHAFLALTLLLGLALAVTGVARHRRRVRRQVRTVMEAGIAAGEDAIDAEEIDGLTRFRHAYDLALVFAALLLALYGVWMLVTRVRWS